nr:uncharacterized protein LOC109189671 [Ipomoea trifida]
METEGILDSVATLILADLDDEEVVVQRVGNVVLGPSVDEKEFFAVGRLVSDKPNVDPDIVDLEHAAFWIQVHGLSAGFRSESVLQAIGGFIGRFVKSDERNFDGSLRVFFRIRVEVDVSKPLKKGMKFKKDNGEWFSIEFRYERLPTFCFVCGILGHGDRFCPKAAPGRDPKMVKPNGPEL